MHPAERYLKEQIERLSAKSKPVEIGRTAQSPDFHRRTVEGIIEHAWCVEAGVSDGFLGFTEEQDTREINRRLRVLRKEAKERAQARALMSPAADPTAAPAGMQHYKVTYKCGHQKAYILKAGFTEDELAECYGEVDCPDCAKEARRLRAGE